MESILPFHLKSLENQNFPKDKIDIFFHTNDNKDKTIQVINDWISDHGSSFNSVELKIKNFGARTENHHWNMLNFRYIAQIRQTAWDYAREIGSTHMFMVDSDIVYHPETLEKIFTHNVDIVYPLVNNVSRHRDHYNFFHRICPRMGGILDQQVEIPSNFFQVQAGVSAFLAKFDIPVQYILEGNQLPEDMVFAKNLRDNNIPINVDASRLFGWHLYTPKDIVLLERLIADWNW